MKDINCVCGHPQEMHVKAGCFAYVVDKNENLKAMCACQISVDELVTQEQDARARIAELETALREIETITNTIPDGTLDRQVNRILATTRAALENKP